MPCLPSLILHFLSFLMFDFDVGRKSSILTVFSDFGMSAYAMHAWNHVYIYRVYKS